MFEKNEYEICLLGWKVSNIQSLQVVIDWVFDFFLIIAYSLLNNKVNAARKSKVDDNTARMQSIKQLGV